MTGYVVHYSDGDTDRNESVPASSTSTGLTNCISYTFSVEATSEHLSGESDTLTIELGEHFRSYSYTKYVLITIFKVLQHFLLILVYLQ